MASASDAMDGTDARISNGTCWSKKNTRASDYFLPCGNAAGPDLNFACCYKGDTCLSSNSCYNPIHGITYMVGCTDKNYSAAVCGDKGDYFDQEWVGLVRCYVSDDLTAKDEEWAGCLDDDETFPVTPRACDCQGKKYLFKDNKVLTGTAKVPYASGGSISFLPGYSPTATQVVTATSWETTEGPPGITAPPTQVPAPGTSIPTTDSTTESQPPLSTGAEIGVAVGSGVAGLVVFGLVLVYVLLRNRKKEAGQSTAPKAPEGGGERGGLETGTDSRRLEGELGSNKTESNSADEPHTSQNGRESRQCLYGSQASHSRYPSNFHRLSTISEHSTIPDPQSPESSKVAAPPLQAVEDNSGDPTQGSGPDRERLVEGRVHELPG